MEAAPGEDQAVREAAFAHLDRLLALSPDGTLRSADVNTFTWRGSPVRLMVQSGIWKPAGFRAALSIRTTFTPPDRPPPYEDDLAPDGLLRYKYRGTDPGHSDNRALRSAMESGVPLIYFVGVDRGVYVPVYPVWIAAEDPDRLEFAVSVDEAQQFLDLSDRDAPSRRYAHRLTLARLHQPVFRSRVLHAYGSRCAICRLHQARLVDAAHIIPDGRPLGDPVVPNGLSLCKIHHAAYDADLLAVRPDLVVEVAPRILQERDGPMLLHGLQEMDGRRIEVPARRSARPDPERLDVRYREFRTAV